MADISKITLPSGSVYNLKDQQAREDIASIQAAIAGGVSFIGETTTALTDGATTNPIQVNGSPFTAISGSLVVYQTSEFIFDGTKWILFGDLGTLKALAFKDSASGSYTPAGSVSQPTFTGTAFNSTGNFTPAGGVTLTGAGTSSSGAVSYISELGTKSFSGTAATIKPKVTAAGNVTISTGSSGTANYTPAGSVTAPTISVATAGSTTTVNSITAVGTLPEFGATVANENLTLSFSQGTLPTKGANTTVKTGDASYSASAPTFSGTGAVLQATFTGTEVEGTASYTPAGSVTVNATTKYLTGSFSGTQGSVTVSGTATGSVSKPTFSGTAATITVS